MAPETEFHAALDELSRKQDAVTGRITEALVRGEDTALIRAEAASIERAVADLEQRITDNDARREAAAAEAISATGAMIASDAANAILAKLSALAAPEHP
jgi:seryl-tRNA synthetase